MVQIAGGIIVNPDSKVALVNQFGNSWSLPKGHIEKGEDALLAALREIEEETGITRAQLKFIRPLGSYTRSRISKDGRSFVRNAQRELHMFLFETWLTSPLTPKDEDNPEALWVPFDDVSSMLTHPKDREFFNAMRDIHEELSSRKHDIFSYNKKAFGSLFAFFTR